MPLMQLDGRIFKSDNIFRENKMRLNHMKKTNLTVAMLATLLFGFLMAVPNTSLATTIEVEVISTNWADVQIYGTNYRANTEYTLDTSIGLLDAFCVEGRLASHDKEEYEILSVPEQLKEVAWLADQYWTGGWNHWNNLDGRILSKKEFQIAIWEIVMDSPDGNGNYNLNEGNFILRNENNNTNKANIEYILDQTLDNTYNDYVYWVRNPVGYEEPGFQDYLVKHSVPEPTTMLLLGFSILVLGVCRKSFLGFNKV